MVGFDARKTELEALGVKLVASSVDPLDKAGEVAEQVYFPVGYGVTRDVATLLDAWWEDRRQIIQPSEFVLDPSGTVVASSYSDGPLGRMDAADVVKLVGFHRSRS